MTKIKNVIKSDDYAVVHADGIITQIGDEVTKLVFYQQINLPNDGNQVDQNEVTKVLQFEVRIPRSVIRNTSEYIATAEKGIDEGNEALEHTDDEKIHSIQNDLTFKLENILVDSNIDYSEDNEVRTLLEQMTEFQGRLNREKGIKSKDPEL